MMEKRERARRLIRLGVAAAAPLLVMLAIGGPATAQQSVGIDPGRDCQTIRTCNFGRGGSFRGCLSSYTCRVCRPQRVRCSASDTATGRRQCTELVCSWGG
jgi:hypothetical protein